MDDTDTKRTVPGWLLIGGLASLLVGAFAFSQAQRAARIRASADSLRELAGQPVTEAAGMDGGMVLAAVLAAFGAMMVLAYLIGLAVRR